MRAILISLYREKRELCEVAKALNIGLGTCWRLYRAESLFFQRQRFLLVDETGQPIERNHNHV